MIALLAPLVLAAELPLTGLVSAVYDGDTLTLASGERVRLRGVNAPELRPMEPLATEAKEAARALVEGRDVRLHATGRDRFGRVVASLSWEGQDLATMLVREGLAHVYLLPPHDADLAVLLEVQHEARAHLRGIWALPAHAGPVHATSFHADAPGPDELRPSGEYARVCNTSDGELHLKGWSVREEHGQVYPIPEVRLPAGHTLILASGSGTDQLDPAQQLLVHLRTPGPIYDNEGARFELLDPGGRVVTHRSHKGG